MEKERDKLTKLLRASFSNSCGSIESMATTVLNYFKKYCDTCCQRVEPDEITHDILDELGYVKRDSIVKRLDNMYWQIKDDMSILDICALFNKLIEELKAEERRT